MSDVDTNRTEAVVERMQARLAQLRQEYQLGERQLRELLAQEATLRETMLRISGAIQVIEELLPDAEPPTPAPSASVDGEPRILTVP
jgi:outer membrane protein TolC